MTVSLSLLILIGVPALVSGVVIGRRLAATEMPLPVVMPEVVATPVPPSVDRISLGVLSDPALIVVGASSMPARAAAAARKATRLSAGNTLRTSSIEAPGARSIFDASPRRYRTGSPAPRDSPTTSAWNAAPTGSIP